MDVDIDPTRIDLDGEEKHRVAAAWQQAVGRLQRGLQTAAVDRTSIHEQGHPTTTGTGDFGARDRALIVAPAASTGPSATSDPESAWP